MRSELWFVTDGVKILSVFRNPDDAQRELDRYEDDPDYQYYECYSVDTNDLADYPEEYELAFDQGLID